MMNNINYFNEKCGVFGITNNENSSIYAALGLHSMQHRGQEGAGIVSFDGYQYYSQKSNGLVSHNFTDESVINSLKGFKALGHNRYSTSGDETPKDNIQPFQFSFDIGNFVFCHNGNITNFHTLKNELTKNGCIFQTTSDTEVIAHLMSMFNDKDIIIRLKKSLKQLKGAYSLVCMTNDKLIGIRDPNGIRPLCLGKIDNSYILCSESCALDMISAEYVREIEPGEIIEIDNENRISSIKYSQNEKSKFCIFEYVYFSKASSKIKNKSVYGIRKNLGIELAKESTTDADMVAPVPDSGIPASLGFSKYSGIPFEMGIIKNSFNGRTFIEPHEKIRDFSVKLKHSPNKDIVENKKIILIDDSIVRGTTCNKLISMLKNAGAKEVHVRITSPPTKNPCFYGIDTPKKENLMANNMDKDRIKNYINADSLEYLSINGMYRAVNNTERDNFNPQYCDACFTGDYPVELTDKNNNFI